MEFHKTHRVADLTFPAVTITPERNFPSTKDSAKWTSDIIINHVVEISIRVHTKYIGDIIDQRLNSYYMDEIIDVLNRNRDLGIYRVMEFSTASYSEQFPDSGTSGAQVNVILHRVARYTQTT